MIHEHHQWFADLNASIVQAYERDAEMAREPSNIQRTGHRVESRWDSVLKDWLPPQYALGKRKYLLLEKEDGPPSTNETDLVIFYPHYPEKLRDNESVLASGVAAVFSVKRTIGRKEIKDAYEDAIALRHGMEIRDQTPKGYLSPPVFYGLLADSHSWKSPNSNPEEMIKEITSELDRELLKSPREGLDFICVADLGTWVRNTNILTAGFLSDNPQVQFLLGVEAIVITGMRHRYEEEQPLSPLTKFVGSLWEKLALNDHSLKPLADGLRITKTADDSGIIGTGIQPMRVADLVPEWIVDRVNRNYSNGPDWNWVY